MIRISLRGTRMATLSNQKHELFAQAIAKGTRHEHAYRAAGYKPKNSRSAVSAASRLLSNSGVSARVAELTAEIVQVAVNAVGISKTNVIQMLMGDRQRAIGNGQIGQALRAAELMGKAIGMFIHRKEVVPADAFEGMSKDELRASIAANFRAIGRADIAARFLGETEEAGEKPH
jgi:hypothetical protein